jgi:hypothetical protein
MNGIGNGVKNDAGTTEYTSSLTNSTSQTFFIASKLKRAITFAVNLLLSLS